VVLYAGRKVEARPRAALADRPRHPYAELLISSVPQLRQGWLEEVEGRGHAALPTLSPSASAAAPSALCPFLARCGVRVDGLCTNVAPPRQVLDNGVEILCHHAADSLRRLQRDHHGVEEPA
jgi:peptide/nickel transport system ATP-binding protein